MCVFKLPENKSMNSKVLQNVACEKQPERYEAAVFAVRQFKRFPWPARCTCRRSKICRNGNSVSKLFFRVCFAFAITNVSSFSLRTHSRNTQIHVMIQKTFPQSFRSLAQAFRVSLYIAPEGWPTIRQEGHYFASFHPPEGGVRWDDPLNFITS